MTLVLEGPSFRAIRHWDGPQVSGQFTPRRGEVKGEPGLSIQSLDLSDFTNISTFVKVVLGALGGVVLTLAPVAIFSGGPMISGAPMMNNGMLGGAAMVVMLLVGAAILFAWVLGLAAVVDSPSGE